ncbi:MAG: hypothetical protein AUG89_07405 [Acidobacteria bacterium 13_1_20CM_4_56_7]|nr:MAG: hypothetical protein AUG89_07405 [Acidobacteria bacterium 13_1_20CM_4_56_7]
MTTLYRILSVLTLSALMSTPVLRAQDDQSYDAQTDQQYDQNQNYDQNESTPRAEDQPLETPQYDAQNNSEPATPDPPSRVASLRYMDGSVSVQPQGTGDWVAGEINRPVTNSDNIWADKNSRAELSVGSGIIRIGSESSLTITNIAEDTVQLQLHQGALNLHVRRLFDNEKYEVDTPNQAFTVLKPGDYRFDVDPDGDKSVVTVWSGEGESTGDGPAVRIRANEQVRFTNGTSMTVDVHTAPRPDSFDEWALNRDQRRDHSESSRYVSPDVVGSDDLDEYGTWRSTPEYGEVWSPRVDTGWAPYTNGHWIWDDPWGWTWVDYEPWGFAPFHYGRWVYDSGFWGWAPGPAYVRPYYAPALVAWFGGGFGGGFGVGVGFGGGFGWCPLGFGEPFIPWYGVSRGYFNQVNITNTRITNVTNITNIYNNNFSHGRVNVHNGYQMRYANMHAPGGFTAVSRHALVNSLSVQRNRIRVAPNQLSRVSAVHSPGVAPTRASIIGSRGVRAAVPPQRAFARPVVSRTAVSAGNRGSLNAGARAGASTANRGSFNANSRNAGPGNASTPGQTAVAQRPTFGGAQQRPAIGANRGGFNNSVGANNRGPAFNNARGPQNGSIGSRSVPRPQASTGNFGSRGVGPGSINSRPMNPQSSIGSRSMNAPQMNARSNVPRPPMAGGSRPSLSPRGNPNFSRPSAPQSSPAPRSNERNGPRAAVSVPRPSGAVAQRGYASGSDRGNYSSPRPSPSYQPNSRPNYGGGSQSRPSPSYGGGSYNRPSPPSRDYGRPAPSNRGSYGRSAPPPSYGGSRSTPSYGGGRAPSYGSSGGHSMSMPSYGGGGFGGGRSASPSFGGGRAPSYGGGGGRSMPSYGGGGGGRSGGFGGGHMPSGGGGGGHSGGGGGGASHSSGGGGGHGHH